MPNPASFSEEPYHTEFLKIREALRQFSQSDILEQCFQYLRKPVPGSRPDIDKQSWTVLLVIKWAYLDEGPWQNRKIDVSTLEHILAKVRALVDLTRKPSQYECSLFFWRTLAFQQDSYQGREGKFRVGDVARQLFLFNGLESNDIDRSSFLKKTGISIETFFDFAFLLCGHVEIGETEPLTVEWFSTLNEQYPIENASKFLDAISVQPEQIGLKLAPYSSNFGKSKEFYELTPFTNFPLLKISNNGKGSPYYLFLNKSILFRTLGHFAFDFLKREEGHQFPSRFGKSFEKYVGRVLDSQRKPYRDEDFIKAFARQDEKVADFWIQEFDCNIFIDAKAVEMTKNGRVSYESEHIRWITKTNVRKAAWQCNSAARVISRGVPGSDRPTTFAIIVTYRDMYLMDGVRFNRMIGAEDQLALQAEFGAATIPPENTFFLSISDFEKLICSLKKRNRRIGEFLKKVRSDDRPRSEKTKMFFSMHLGAARFNSTPDFLLQEYKAAMARVESSLLKGKPDGY